MLMVFFSKQKSFSCNGFRQIAKELIQNLHYTDEDQKSETKRL